MLKTFPYTQGQTDLFENIVSLEDLQLNHVLIPEGKVFPAHPTDAEVYILLLKGTLSIAIDGEKAVKYPCGQVIHIPLGTLSELGNLDEEQVEAFIVKKFSLK